MSRCENVNNPTAAIERFYHTCVYEGDSSPKTSENNGDASLLFFRNHHAALRAFTWLTSTSRSACHAS